MLDQSKTNTYQTVAAIWTSILCWNSPVGRLQTHFPEVADAIMGLEYLLLELLL